MCECDDGISGEMGALTGQRRSASVMCESPVRLYYITSRHLVSQSVLLCYLYDAVLTQKLASNKPWTCIQS